MNIQLARETLKLLPLNVWDSRDFERDVQVFSYLPNDCLAKANEILRNTPPEKDFNSYMNLLGRNNVFKHEPYLAADNETLVCRYNHYLTWDNNYQFILENTIDGDDVAFSSPVPFVTFYQALSCIPADSHYSDVCLIGIYSNLLHTACFDPNFRRAYEEDNNFFMGWFNAILAKHIGRTFAVNLDKYISITDCEQLDSEVYGRVVTSACSAKDIMGIYYTPKDYLAIQANNKQYLFDIAKIGFDANKISEEYLIPLNDCIMPAIMQLLCGMGGFAITNSALYNVTHISLMPAQDRDYFICSSMVDFINYIC